MTSIGRSIGLLLIVSTTLTTACAHTPTNPIADPAEVRTAIEGTLVQFGAAMKRADAGAIASMFTEDGEVIVATTKGFITGRAAIEEFWRARFKAARFIDVAIATVSVQVEGNTAYETGTTGSTVQVGDSPPVTRTGRYLTVWKRQPNGVWLIRVDAIIPDPAG
jgi:uncharacterized protein (TIGR02246 family)